MSDLDDLNRDDLPEPARAVADCPFCRIIAGQAPATFVRRWDDAIAIAPLGPVVEGHTLVIPVIHVADFTSDPYVTGAVARRAAELAGEVGGDMNLITSKGRAATQSVFHLHVHLVPRAVDDGLALPWTSGKRSPAPGGQLVNLTFTGPSPNDARAAGYSAGLAAGYEAGRRRRG